MRLLFKSFSDGSTLKNEKRLLFLLAMFITFKSYFSIQNLILNVISLPFLKKLKIPVSRQYLLV